MEQTNEGVNQSTDALQTLIEQPQASTSVMKFAGPAFGQTFITNEQEFDADAQ